VLLLLSLPVESSFREMLGFSLPQHAHHRPHFLSLIEVTLTAIVKGTPPKGVGSLVERILLLVAGHVSFNGSDQIERELFVGL